MSTVTGKLTFLKIKFINCKYKYVCGRTPKDSGATSICMAIIIIMIGGASNSVTYYGNALIVGHLNSV
jgi:hypothetical protein